ncbi:MAG: DUF1592 domain-containing protein [Planctomycetota bacterium]
MTCDGSSWEGRYWRRRCFVICLIILPLLFAGPRSVIAEEPIAGTSQFKVLTEQFCAECHSVDQAVEADLDLSQLSLDDLRKDAEATRRIMDVIEQREMPPEDAPQLSDQQRLQFLEELRAVFRQAIAHGGSGERTSIRRMNRFQYNNAVVDLFDLRCTVFTLPERAMRVHRNYFQPETGKMPEQVAVGNRPLGKSQMIEPRLAGVAAFPQDLRAEHGYDNRADHLSLSPMLMDELLKLGRSITQSPDFHPKQVGIWKSFFAKPSVDQDLGPVVRERLRRFLTRAFRRPADESLVDRYSSFVLSMIASGSDFPEAMKAAAAATISSPRFLYLYEGGSDQSSESSRSVSDFELATRLSFFLWGSAPDDTLLSLAESEQLHDDEVLNEQIDRLLRDRKLKRFCDQFPAQWLQLDRIVSSVPNRERFPSFYFSKYRSSMHMMMEPLLLFETVLIEDLPITQLIDSDFTYRSKKLSQSYAWLAEDGSNIKSTGGGVTVLNFQRIPVSDRRVGGVITNAAVMTMTSGPDRTQPITRGAWIASVIFNDPPEPPPADVPPLPEQPLVGEENLTIRERLAAHRERADCRGCHEQIDPLGFALENYDPVGHWRTEDEQGNTIDPSGQLFREYAFNDVVEFKDAILADPDRFCRAFAGHLMSFALARELGPKDRVALDQITQTVKDDGYKMKTLIRQIILSEPFRTR